MQTLRWDAMIITNKEVRRKIQTVTEQYHEYHGQETKIKVSWTRLKVSSMSSDLAKLILQGTVKGKRKR